MKPFVQIHNLSIAYAGIPVLQDLSWTIYPGEQVVLGGQSGSGKTTLAKALAEQMNSNALVQVNYASNSQLASKTIYISNWYQFTNLEGDRNFYYQQRYNKHQGHDTLTVQAELQHYAHKENLNWESLLPKLQQFGFTELLSSQLIELSSGEHKKLQLLKGLWLKPQLLLIDEPYTGLDKASRQVLNCWLDELVEEGVQLILISNDQQYPSSINSFAHIVEGKLERVSKYEDLVQDRPRERKELPSFLKIAPNTPFEYVARLRNIVIRYDEKQVLKNVSWDIKVGERWLLQGPNGSGKSTLLSILNGDHPQSYGLDIELFGHKRGTGESIWDIKQKIGMISPEMHWYFDPHATVWHTIASGFYDSIGWFIDVKLQEKKQLDDILDFFELTNYKNQLLHTLPLGKQRLAMLARCIIKNPALLVLDEPCQGLDAQQAQYFNDVVDELSHFGKTLIYVGHYESQLPNNLTHQIRLERGAVVALENIEENVL